jgi:hypothetical protein
VAIGTSQLLKNCFVWWHVRGRAVWLNAGASLASSVALWSAAVAACFAIKATVAAPALVQLLLGIIVIGAAALLQIRGPILCPSDRDLLLRLFQGREARLLRVLGVLNPPGGPQAAR